MNSDPVVERCFCKGWYILSCRPSIVTDWVHRDADKLEHERYRTRFSLVGFETACNAHYHVLKSNHCLCQILPTTSEFDPTMVLFRGEPPHPGTRTWVDPAPVAFHSLPNLIFYRSETDLMNSSSRDAPLLDYNTIEEYRHQLRQRSAQYSTCYLVPGVSSCWSNEKYWLISMSCRHNFGSCSIRVLRCLNCSSYRRKVSSATSRPRRWTIRVRSQGEPSWCCPTVKRWSTASMFDSNSSLFFFDRRAFSCRHWSSLLFKAWHRCLSLSSIDWIYLTAAR